MGEMFTIKGKNYRHQELHVQGPVPVGSMSEKLTTSVGEEQEGLRVARDELGKIGPYHRTSGKPYVGFLALSQG